MRQPSHPLRVALPMPFEVVRFDELGRKVRGRTAEIRRLYADERCGIDELAAFFAMPRHKVSYALRNKAALQNRRRGIKVSGRASVRVMHSAQSEVRAFNAWPPPSWALHAPTFAGLLAGRVA